MKENITFSIDDDVARDFKKKCLDKDISYSDAVEELMKEYNKRK